MSFGSNQKGIIQLGLLGLIVLTGGLFLASKLASNPDLTFFNIAEQAKTVQKNICETKRGEKLLRCKEKSKKDNSTKTQSASCDGWTSCKGKPFEGAKLCPNGNYCCISPKRDLGNGKCETLDKCSSAACSDYPIKGGDRCQDTGHPNGRYCCKGGKHVLTDNLGIQVCSGLAGNPPPCPANAQCSPLSNGGSLCFKTNDPDTAYYCK